MKKISILFILLSFTLGNITMYSQEKKSRKERKEEQVEKIKKLVESQNYTFYAQRALPMSGRSINLTSTYDLRVSREKVSAYLPYFGRAYVAPMDPREGGIHFDTEEFDYRPEQAKKGGWTVHITPKNIQKNYNLILNISSNGSATLSVNDPNRQTINFNGYIDELKAEN